MFIRSSRGGRAPFETRPPRAFISTNGSQSGMPWVLRISAVTGISRTAAGCLSNFRPASCGRRLPFLPEFDRLCWTRHSFPRRPCRRANEAGRGRCCLPHRAQHRPSGVLGSDCRMHAHESSGRAELRALLGHLGKVGQRHDDRRHRGSRPRTVCTAWSCSRMSRVSHSAQVHRADVLFAFNFQRGGHVGCHLAKGILRRADVDRLPIAVQDQHGRFIQYVVHKVFAYGHSASRVVAMIRCLDFIVLTLSIRKRDSRKLAGSPEFSPGPVA